MLMKRTDLYSISLNVIHNNTPCVYNYVLLPIRSYNFIGCVVISKKYWS